MLQSHAINLAPMSSIQLFLLKHSFQTLQNPRVSNIHRDNTSGIDCTPFATRQRLRTSPRGGYPVFATFQQRNLCTPSAVPPADGTYLLGRAGKLQKTLASPDIGVLVRLGLWWEGSVGGPEIDQRLHGLKLGGLEHVEGSGCQDKVREATVELLFQVKVVEWVGEVSPVEMSVDTEHLSEDHLADVEELVGEAGSLADPFGLTRIRQLGKRGGAAGSAVGV